MKFNLTLVILVILGVQISQQAIQWQDGLSQNIQQGGGHTLETSTATPRYEDIRVNFDNEFSLTPQVVLSLQDISWENGQGADFKVKLLDVDTQGFSYRVNVNFDRSFNSVGVKWFAFVDPHLQQENYEFKLYGVNGDSEKSQTQFSVEFDREYKEAPNVAVFLLGAKWNQDGGSYDVHVDTTDITEKGCNIQVNTYNNGNPYSVYTQLVILPQDRSTINQEGGLLELSESDGQQSQNLATQINEDYSNEEAVLFYGLSGFSSATDKQFNILLNSEYVDQNLGINVSSSIDSGLQNANVDAFGYIPSDDCSFLFVGCNFSGNGISICQDQAKNSFSGTHLDQNLIKSVYVPQGQVLTLYEDENLQGRTSTISQSQECIEQLQADE